MAVSCCVVTYHHAAVRGEHRARVLCLRVPRRRSRVQLVDHVSMSMCCFQLSSISLLKIDCEGDEHNVLLGLHHSDWSCIDAISMEVHTEERITCVTLLLAQHGFAHEIVTTMGEHRSASRHIYAWRDAER